MKLVSRYVSKSLSCVKKHGKEKEEAAEAMVLVSFYRETLGWLALIRVRSDVCVEIELYSVNYEHLASFLSLNYTI